MLQQTFLADSRTCLVYRIRSKTALILCTGLGTSMSEPRYLWSILARRAAELGFSVFQFDYRGDGDSPDSHLDVSSQHLHISTKSVIDFARSQGCQVFGLLGYGIGTLVASWLLALDDVVACVLVSPHFAVYDDIEVWEFLKRLCAEESNQTLYPSTADNKTPLAELWRHVIGETAVPSQPPGPISAAFLRSLQTEYPYYSFSSSGKPILVISESLEDALSNNFVQLNHDATLYQPSWHWSMACRDQIIDHCLDWFIQHTGQDRDLFKPNLAWTPQGIDNQDSVQIESNDQMLLGILTRPMQSSKAPVCIIYEPGIPGQRVDIHRCGPRLAAELAEVGLFTFRYDSRGTGVSDGEFYNFTWGEKIRDISTVMQHLSEFYDIDKFILIGNSSGARITTLIANTDDRVIGSVLWSPIFVEPSQRTGGNSVFRLTTGQLVSEFCGLHLSMRYTVEERRHRFLEVFRECTKPMRIFFGDREQNQINQAIITDIASQRINIHQTIVKGEHGFASRPIEMVIRETAYWSRELVSGL